eukprot:3562348-Amphidinium_carterae.2
MFSDDSRTACAAATSHALACEGPGKKLPTNNARMGSVKVTVDCALSQAPNRGPARARKAACIRCHVTSLCMTCNRKRSVPTSRSCKLTASSPDLCVNDPRVASILIQSFLLCAEDYK